MNNISIISAIASQTRAIGNKNGLIFRISEDLRRFKSLTVNHPIIMGRKTFESIGRSLPNRTNIVISRREDFKPEGVLVAKSLASALEIAKKSSGSEEIFVIGGGEIYKEFLPLSNRLYLTIVESNEVGDTFFPDYSEFKKTVHQEQKTDEKSGLRYTFVILEK